MFFHVTRSSEMEPLVSEFKSIILLFADVFPAVLLERGTNDPVTPSKTQATRFTLFSHRMKGGVSPLILHINEEFFTAGCPLQVF